MISTFDNPRVGQPRARAGARPRNRFQRIVPVATSMALIVAACGSSQSDGSDSAQPASTTASSSTSSATTAPTTSQTTTTTPAPSSEATAALAVADTYFAELHAGNVDDVFSVFAPAITIEWFNRISRTEFEMITAFFAGQGTIYTPPDCEVNHEVPGESMFVFCELETHTAGAQAVDAPGVETRLTMVVTPDGIERLTYSYDRDLDFHPVEDPFEIWRIQSYPEYIEFGDWTSLEEARQQGQLVAQTAPEWATHLAENKCTYLDAC